MSVTGGTTRRGDGAAYVRQLVRRLEGGPRAVLVGFPRGEVDSDIVSRAAYNEFGTSRGVPERPFMRITMGEKAPEYQDALREGTRRVIRGESDKKRELSRLGLRAAGDIQQTISSSVPPPNVEATVRRKGSSTTLIDTGQMRQSVTWVLEE